MSESSRRIYRIFVSSCSKMLEDERKYLIDTILRKGHYPIAMEFNFGGSNTSLTIEVDKSKIEECDCVIVLIGHLYGEIIGEKIGGRKWDICPFSTTGSFPHSNCDDCHGSNCHISFTHFEYCYAIYLNKPVYVIVYESYDNQESFEQKHNQWKKDHNGNCLALWGEGIVKNKLFAQVVNSRMRFQYSSFQQFREESSHVLDIAIREMQDNIMAGLIPVQEYHNVPRLVGPAYKQVFLFSQNERPKETFFSETIKDCKEFCLLARSGVNFLSRYLHEIQNAIAYGCKCKFIILNKDCELIRNGYYETVLDKTKTETSYAYLYELKKNSPQMVSVHLTDHYPPFDIEYFKKTDGRQTLIIQTHFLLTHLGSDRPMFMLSESDYWYQTFKDELDTTWYNTPEMRWEN